APAAAGGTAAATTSSLTCPARMTRATAGCSATAPCRRARSARHVWRRPTVPSARSRSSRGRDMAADDRFTEDYRDRREDGPVGTRNEIITGPVSDWAEDFSHLEPEWAADPYPIQDDLRQRCPIAHTERFGGGWLPTRYEDVSAIAYDTDHFSRGGTISAHPPPPRRGGAGGRLAADPPRPAVPPRRAQAAAPRVHQEGGGQAGAGDEGVLPLAHRRVRGAGRGRRRR